MIVVIGGTGFIGSRVVAKLGADGHEAVAASRSAGVNTLTGEGLADALAGASVVIDVSNVQGLQDAEMLEFFETSTQNLLAAAAPGVRHYVALSVVGCDGLPDSGYLRAKVAQADLIENSVVPYSMIYPDTISGDLDRRASTSSTHVERAFPFAGSEPSTSSESRTGQALSIIYTPDNRRDLEEPGLGWARHDSIASQRGLCGRSDARRQRSPPFARALSSVAASMSVNVAVSILSINGPVNRPIGPPLGTYR